VSSVDPLFAQWLQTEALWVAPQEATIAARWTSTVIVAERRTGIALKADADAEAARQLAFFARGPFAIDVHQLVGDGWLERLGKVATLSIDKLGYDAGVDVFVLEAEYDRSTGISTVAVACPLGDAA
jgi:hypothetical protein